MLGFEHELVVGEVELDPPLPAEGSYELDSRWHPRAQLEQSEADTRPCRLEGLTDGVVRRGKGDSDEEKSRSAEYRKSSKKQSRSAVPPLKTRPG